MTKDNNLTMAEIRTLRRAAEIMNSWGETHDQFLVGEQAVTLSTELWWFAADREIERSRR